MILPLGLGKFDLADLNHMRTELPRCSVLFLPPTYKLGAEDGLETLEIH